VNPTCGCNDAHLRAFCSLHSTLMVNGWFRCADTYGFEKVDAVSNWQSGRATPLFRVPGKRKFTPTATIQILRKFSQSKTLKIYRAMV